MNEPSSRWWSVCGIDEAGRGPLAGPVTAAAVVLPRSPSPQVLGLADSKTLSAPARQRAAAQVVLSSARIALGWAWPTEIDELNIHHATLLAMQRAHRRLRELHPAAPKADVLVDGKFCPDIDSDSCSAVVGGDALIPAVMAASILAKVYRDRWMESYAARDGRFGFERHKGYPTPAHYAALRRHGPCEIHRLSFRGVSADVRESK
jgi:ribonuclease HII